MTQAITVGEYKKFSDRLNRLEVLLGKIAEKIAKSDAPYGSAKWWDNELSQSLLEYKKGKGKVITNKKELSTYLDSLDKK